MTTTIDAMLTDLEMISKLVMSIVVPTKNVDQSNFTTPISLMVRHHLVGGQSPLADRDVRGLVVRADAAVEAGIEPGRHAALAGEEAVADAVEGDDRAVAATIDLTNVAERDRVTRGGGDGSTARLLERDLW